MWDWTLVCLWCGRTVGRAYGHVITKFSRMDSLPHFLSYGAPSTHASRACGAPLLVDLWRSIFEISAGRSFAPSQKTPPPQLCLCVSRSPFWCDFRRGAKAFRYSVKIIWEYRLPICYMRRFAATIFRLTQRCNIFATLVWMTAVLFQHSNEGLR